MTKEQEVQNGHKIPPKKIEIKGQAMFDQLQAQRNEAFDRLAQAKAYIVQLEDTLKKVEAKFLKATMQTEPETE